MTRRNCCSNSMILLIKNIKINDNKHSLLTSDNIQKLNFISINYSNDNSISTNTISKIFDIRDSDEELKKMKFQVKIILKAILSIKMMILIIMEI